MINWKVRLKNKYFWLTLIPALMMLLSELFGIFGVYFDSDGIGESVKSIIEAVFTVLAILGIVNDPTTATLADSVNAMTYECPKKSCLETEAEKGDDAVGDKNNTEADSEEQI